MNTKDFKLDDFKNAVSILEYIKFRKDLHFSFSKNGKSITAKQFNTAADLELFEKGGEVNPINKILITRFDANSNSQNQSPDIKELYNREFEYNSNQSLTIIDFIHEFVRKKKDFKDTNNPNDKIEFGIIIGMMKQFINSPNFVHIDNSSIVLKLTKPKSTNQKAKKVSFNVPSIQTLNYLKSRKLISSTISDPLFNGTYGSYTNENRGPDERPIIDMPCFPIKSYENKLQTLQWINFDGKQHHSKYLLEDVPRENALFSSNHDKLTNTIIIAEAPEKTMAHYQLYNSQMKAQKIHPKYFSSCGQFTGSDMDHVKLFAAKLRINRFVLAFDNDKAGSVYTLKFILTQNLIVPSFKLTQPDGSHDLTVVFDKDIQRLKSYFKSKNVEYIMKDNNLIVNANSEKLFNKLSTPNVLVHLSITKDFLDDIKLNSSSLPFNFKPNNNNTLKL